MNGWQPIVDALGGNGPTCRSLGVSPATLQRLKTGQAAIPPPAEAALNATCAQYGLPRPDPPRAPVEELAIVGQQIKLGLTPARPWLNRLQRKYPGWQLAELAEGEETPEEILRAVTYLLESE